MKEKWKYMDDKDVYDTYWDSDFPALVIPERSERSVDELLATSDPDDIRRVCVRHATGHHEVFWISGCPLCVLERHG